MCVCECVCVCEREREHVCACVWTTQVALVQTAHISKNIDVTFVFTEECTEACLLKPLLSLET